MYEWNSMQYFVGQMSPVSLALYRIHRHLVLFFPNHPTNLSSRDNLLPGHMLCYIYNFQQFSSILEFSTTRASLYLTLPPFPGYYRSLHFKSKSSPVSWHCLSAPICWIYLWCLHWVELYQISLSGQEQVKHWFVQTLYWVNLQTGNAKHLIWTLIDFIETSQVIQYIILFYRASALTTFHFQFHQLSCKCPYFVSLVKIIRDQGTQ